MTRRAFWKFQNEPVLTKTVTRLAVLRMLPLHSKRFAWRRGFVTLVSFLTVLLLIPKSSLNKSRKTYETVVFCVCSQARHTHSHCVLANGVSQCLNVRRLLFPCSHDLVEVDLNNLETMKQEDNWDDLILPLGHKEMVQAMVEAHTQASSLAIEGTRSRGDYEVDLVPGKGKRILRSNSRTYFICTK